MIFNVAVIVVVVAAVGRRSTNIYPFVRSLGIILEVGTHPNQTPAKYKYGFCQVQMKVKINEINDVCIERKRCGTTALRVVKERQMMCVRVCVCFARDKPIFNSWSVWIFDDV